MTKTTLHAVPIEAINAFNRSMQEESDRARVLLAAMWMDYFLTCRLSNEFGKGNGDARKRLFGPTGPFSSFAAKIDIAFCAGWVSSGLHHDMHLLRRVRNNCAHSLDFPGLNDDGISKQISQLRTPGRQYYDWGDLKAGVTADGAVIIYSGDGPEDVTEDLDFTIPGSLGFRMGIPVVIAVLISELGVPLILDENGSLMIAELPEHMRKAQQEDD
ncbi:MAG: hypothetical protein KAV00_07405 [Phycisphaerae bacterium]|nr:hypothetical protein [Phycisphaerae bacterium]